MTALTAPPTGRTTARPTRWPALRVFEHHALVYRRTWRGSLFTGFVSPVLFLAAMGLGLGTLVDANNPGGVAGVSYLAFLAPGLLSAIAMQTAAFESTYPIMAGLQWMKTYDAMVTTPISPRSVVLGQLAWVTTRLTLVTAVYSIVMVIRGGHAGQRPHRPSLRHPDRPGVRRSDPGVRGHAAQRHEVQRHLPVRDHPLCSSSAAPSSRSASCPSWCSRSPT